MAKTRAEKAKGVYVIAGDLSLRRPAIAILCTTSKNKAEVCNVYVIETNQSAKKRTGEILSHIERTMTTEILPETKKMADKKGYSIVAVRERGFTRFHNETQALFKVVGVTDLALNNFLGTEWDNIPPLTVKKLITGSGKATKAEVAKALSQYLTKPIDENTYSGDDETDAIAVGVSWMLGNGYIIAKEEKGDTGTGKTAVQGDKKPRRTVPKGTKKENKGQ